MTRLPALFPALALAGLPLVLATQESETDWSDLAARALERAAGASVERVWTQAGALAAHAGEPELEAALDRALERTDLAPQAVLLAASLRMAGEEADPSLLAERLRPLLDADGALARAAAGLLADRRFKALPEEELSELLDALAEGAADGDREVGVRLACAEAQFALGRGDDRRAARDQMRAVFLSEDPDLRAAAALSLARVGNEIAGPLRTELERLAAVPSEEGRLAASYLKQEDIRELSESKLRRQARLIAQDGFESPAGELGSPEDQFHTVREMIHEWHLEGDKVTDDVLLDAALDGMLGALDKHSSFLSPEEYAEFEQDLEAAYGGIGAYVGEDPDDGLFTITRPIFTGPAYRAGLMSDDKIVRIDDWPTIGKPVDDVIKRLKGRPGTEVRLYVWRRGMDRGLIDRPSEDMAVTVSRESITIPPVQSQLLPGGVGMVELRDFSRVAGKELRSAITELEQAGATSLILDLRLNSGGLLDQAVEVAGLFLPKGTLVVSTESRIARTEHHFTTQDPVVPADFPVAVLIDRFTASASEIVSGALRDYDRAVLVGKRSYGKGSVQNLIVLPRYRDDAYKDENHNGRHDNWEEITYDFDGDGEFDYAPRVKMTIARYLLPHSGSIHRELDDQGNILDPGGVEPDIDVDARSYEGWRLEEMWRLRREHLPRDYVDQHFEANRDLFFELADNDGRDPQRYPQFDGFYQSLNTPLPEDDVRMLLRSEIRRRVQDQRGHEFPPGDYVEDLQVQAAIRELLARRGSSVDLIPAYRGVFREVGGMDSAIAELTDRDRRREMRDRLQAARRGEGQLTPADLALLVEIFDESLGQE